MPLFSASEVTPQQDVLTHVYDEQRRRLAFGRYVGGRWYVEEGPGGRLREVAGATHRGPVLDSEMDDESEDD